MGNLVEDAVVRPSRGASDLAGSGKVGTMRRLFSVVLVGSMLVFLTALPAWACGGLVNPNGSVSLLRTSTLAAYRMGYEHYITAFEFAGGGAEFGSIVPLPGIPEKVVRGGDWTLQRLSREVAQQRAESADGGGQPSSAPAEELQNVQIDALDITILRGGGSAVGRWAKNKGFVLPPDAPEILDFYAERSPIFMAVRFNVERAKDKQRDAGDSIPIHLKIPTDNPWVPLRILALGRESSETIAADVFLLTKKQPELLPEPGAAGSDSGYTLERSEEASSSLMSDLRSDKGMSWVPKAWRMWLTYVKLDIDATSLTHDLAIDVRGGTPSSVAAGLEEPPAEEEPTERSDPGGRSMPWSLMVSPFLALGTVRIVNRVANRI